ncbi:hypothetical protein EAG_10963 [Camponotus floridanus]|uniref:ITPR-interacting domain-containing protein n=3 Tax=Camponotus floridanus TaxID=104421 RepID=E2ALK4_CAMFO|nr:hypothetical protein EAG_10963 [Camponotus floridanus]
MDPENVGKDTILKVTDWLRGIWEMRRRAGGPVQQWIDSIPLPTKSDSTNECQEHNSNKPLTPTEPKNIPFPKASKLPSMTISAPINVPTSSTMNTPILPSSLPHRLARDASFQSDSSHCSSVESLLELRKADPTAILLDLGFGGCSTSPRENDPISRIPKRFLQPSSLQGIAIDEFLKQQQESSESFDSVSLGYRGLTGSPYVAPSEIVQKIMERLREHESHEMDTNSYYCEQYNPLQNPGRLSVLSPDNRQFLEQPRSKSPDMCNKRMIIGQKSFAFGCDGNLIEISNDTNLTSNNTIDNRNSLDINASIELKQSPLEESITLEHRYFSNKDKKLTKQLSFDTVDFPETDQLLKDNREIANSLNIAQNGTNVDNNEQEYNLFNTISTKDEKPEFFDVRRASDGSCDTKSLRSKIFDGRRRFSDGAMRSIESQSTECTLMQKRRSLKRQSRVCDTTANYCEPIRSSIPNAIIECKVDNEEEISSDVTNSTHQPNMLKSLESTESNNLVLKTDTESLLREPNYMSSLSKISETIDKMKCFETIEENLASGEHSCLQDNQVCCCKDKICIDCKRSKNYPDCCRHVDKRKYWKKMKKIMRENKKLEDKLAKSRREVAEIRDMLSSVLSVRMEPGF